MPKDIRASGAGLPASAAKADARSRADDEIKYYKRLFKKISNELEDIDI